MKKQPAPNLLSLATSICQLLFDHGYVAYFAGGFVRDFFLNIPSNEIDIATNASPDQIERLFPKTIAVGKQFGVIVVLLEGIAFEVTTFRKDHPSHDGRHPESVDFSTAEKDALRRDFTINGIFYDPLTEKIWDYVRGQEDIKNRLIRAIGDPSLRFQEDRLRMIRAIRFSARFSFAIEEKTATAIKEHASTLFPSVSMERIWQELQKMSHFPHFDQALLMMQKLGLLPVIFPHLQGVAIEPLLASFPYFPSMAPTITYLLALFPHATLDEKIALCRYLKVSNEEVKLVTFFDQGDQLLLKEDPEDYDWALFYAHPLISIYLEVKKAGQIVREQETFSKTHEKRMQRLEKHIQRIKENRPLVTSADLMARGLTPGKKMGEILKEAARLSVNKDLHSKETLLQLLEIIPKSG